MTTKPAFWQFAGAYLHQDWPEVHGDEWNALDAFVHGEPELARDLPDEITLILTEHETDEALERFVVSQGACFTPAPEDGGYRGWLTEVARRVRGATGNGRS